MKPFFSIVLPTFNSISYIEKCLKSLIDQTFENFEVILVDNSSSDGTLKKVVQFNDKRIKTFVIDNNGILAKSRNLGIKLSSSKWIAFLDSDDWWTNKKLEKIKKIIESNKDFDLIYHKLYISDPKKKISLRKNLYSRNSNNFFKDLIIKGNFIPNSSVVVKKDLLLKVNGISEDKNCFASEDYNCWIKIAKITNNFYFLNESLGYYYINPKGSSRRDMSIPYRHATKKFVKYLSLNDKKKYYSHLFFLNFKFKKNLSKSKFKYCFVYGDIADKIKLLLMIIFNKFNIRLI